MPGLRLSVDSSDIDIRNVIAFLTAQDTVDFNNHLDSQTYIDLDLRYNVGPFTLFGSVTNLFDVSPKYVTNVAAINSDVIGTYMSGSDGAVAMLVERPVVLDLHAAV